MFRKDFQELARVRLREARKLLQEREYSGAHYFVGITVECGLKACIAKATHRYQFPERNSRDLYTHELTPLVKLAGLSLSLAEERAASPAFEINWNIVNDWRVESRYEIIGRIQATDIYSAATSRRGVMRWIRKNW